MNAKNLKRKKAADSRKKKNSSLLKIVIFAVISALVVIASFVSLFLMLYKPSVDTGGLSPSPPSKSDGVETAQGDDSPPSTSADTKASQRKKDYYTFLIMGRDNVGLNTDIIMLVSFDVGSGAINIMQIPRDTYIKVDGSPFKINAVYAIMHNRAYNRGESDVDGTAMRDFSVLLEKDLDIKIDFYALCNIKGFKNIIDIIGGVEMNVPNDMYYSDPDQDLYINLKKGLQTLDGDKAEQFVRYRSGYVEGDIGRIDAQKLFFTALIKQIKGSLSITNVAKIAGEVINNVKTSLSLADIMYFGKAFFGVETADINFITFPGTAVRAEVTAGVWYYIMRRADMHSLLNSYFNVYKNDISEAEFDDKRVFTNNRLAHISVIYESELSDDLSQYIHSARRIDDEGLDISLIN